MALKELNLLGSPKLKGISIFHPITKKEFSGEFLPGGVFLARGKLQTMKGSVVFFDESQELKRTLNQNPGIQAVEVKTRNLTPPEVITVVQEKLKPYLVDCHSENLALSLQLKLKKLRSLIPPQLGALFFLGAIRGEKYPAMMMVNDGVVKWLVQQKLISSYPSELAYVSWSAKIMNSLPAHYKKIALSDSGQGMRSSMDHTPLGVNLTYPGALIPGVGQVDAFIYLFGHLKP
jgi:hypothetical protein